MFGSELKRRFEVRLTLTHEDKNNYMSLRTVRSNHIGQVCVLVCVCLCVCVGLCACVRVIMSLPALPPPAPFSLTLSHSLPRSRSLAVTLVFSFFHSQCACTINKTRHGANQVYARSTLPLLSCSSPTLYTSSFKKKPNRACALPVPCTNPTHF